ncbi:MAG: hypothetical protein HY775_03265 [Acidobacteria bacterium]|nr:hypothetical protein [Acidobacteriota bacterium]
MEAREGTAERKLRRWLWFSTAMYGGGAIIFSLFPGIAERTLGLRGPEEASADGEADPSKGLWHSLGGSGYMATITAASALAAMKPEARTPLTCTLLTAKAASAAAQASYWKRTGRIGYLGGALLDASLFLVTLGLLRRARAARA